MNKDQLDQPDEQALRELFHEAGPRPAVPAADMESIRGAAHVVWQRKYGSPASVHSAGQSSWRWITALAAALIAGVLLAWLIFEQRPSQPSTPALVARVEAVRGPAGLEAGASLASGARVRTPQGAWISLRLAGGQSLRLDERSDIILVSSQDVTLNAGGLYLDSAKGSPVKIQTPVGTFSPVGTQFSLHVIEDDVRLRVREGRVQLHAEKESARALVDAGEELIVRSSGVMQRGEIARAGQAWDWILAGVRMPEIEGRTPRGFFEWIAREKGLELVYASPEAERVSSEVILHGSVDEMNADEALTTVVLSSGLTHRVADGRLIIALP